MAFIANFIHRNGDFITSSTLQANPLPVAEGEALDQVEGVERACRVYVDKIEIMHEGEHCSTLQYR